MFDPPVGVTLPSICPGLAHPVSGLPVSTMRPIKTRFLYGSPRKVNLANTDNSLTHYTKGTQSPHKEAPTACTHTVSGSFHSPSGVLFAFPSRYWFTIGRQVVFSLGSRSSNRLRRVREYHPLCCTFPSASTKTYSTFGLIPVRSPLLRESHMMSFPRGTEMFHFPRFASIT